MAAFQAKTDWKRLKMRENKNYRSVSFLSGTKQKIKKKNCKKIQKIKKNHYGYISGPKMLEKAEKGKI